MDWEVLFGSEGVRWFHTGGIFAGLSATTAEMTIEAVKAANDNLVATIQESLQIADEGEQVTFVADGVCV